MDRDPATSAEGCCPAAWRTPPGSPPPASGRRSERGRDKRVQGGSARVCNFPGGGGNDPDLVDTGQACGQETVAPPREDASLYGFQSREHKAPHQRAQALEYPDAAVPPPGARQRMRIQDFALVGGAGRGKRGGRAAVGQEGSRTHRANVSAHALRVGFWYFRRACGYLPQFASGGRRWRSRVCGSRIVWKNRSPSSASKGRRPLVLPFSLRWGVGGLWW